MSTDVTAAVYFCVDEAGQVLFARRRVTDTDSGYTYWYTGSGTVEETDETPEATAIREVQEEFGATPTSPPVYLGSRMGALDTPEGRKEYLVFDYLVRVNHADVRNAEPKEHDQLMWCAADNPASWPTPQHHLFCEFIRTSYGQILRNLQVRPAPRLFGRI